MGCNSSSSGAGVNYPLDLADTLPLTFELSAGSSSSEAPADGPRVRLAIGTSRYIANRIDGVRVRIQAVEAESMPTKIFAYILQPLNPQTMEKTAAFDHVCSPADLEEYPADEPVPGQLPEWLRLDYVDVLVRSWEEALEFIANVKDDVQLLRDVLSAVETVTAHESTWIE